MSHVVREHIMTHHVDLSVCSAGTLWDQTELRSMHLGRRIHTELTQPSALQHQLPKAPIEEPLNYSETQPSHQAQLPA